MSRMKIRYKVTGTVKEQTTWKYLSLKMTKIEKKKKNIATYITMECKKTDALS